MKTTIRVNPENGEFDGFRIDATEAEFITIASALSWASTNNILSAKDRDKARRLHSKMWSVEETGNVVPQEPQIITCFGICTDECEGYQDGKCVLNAKKIEPDCNWK